MGSSVSGSQTTKTSVPKHIQDASKAGLEAAQRLSQIGYVPYQGPDVAAMTPAMLSSFRNQGQAANAFGMAAPDSPMAGLPKPEVFDGGVRGYSSYGLYKDALQDWKKSAPGQYKAYSDFFINPRTGADAKYQSYNPDSKGGGGGGGSTDKSKWRSGEYLDRMWRPKGYPV
jgi:hypothetical protein